MVREVGGEKRSLFTGKLGIFCRREGGEEAAVAVFHNIDGDERDGKKIINTLCDIRGNVAASRRFPEDCPAGPDLCAVVQFLVAEGIFSLVGNMLDNLLGFLV